MATAEIGSYYISLVPTAHNLTGHINKVMAPAAPAAAHAGHDAGGKFSHAFGAAIGGVAHAMTSAFKIGGAAAAAAVAAAGIVGVKTAAELETANIAFTTMLGSAQSAQSFIADMKAFAAKTPFAFPELVKASQSLISIGITTDKVLPIMTTLGNVTSGMGTGSEGIKRATVALQQMNAAGKITAEDLNQLRDAGIPVYDLLTAATGKSKEEIAAMREEGTLGRAELEALMTALETGKGLERFNGLMEAQSASMAGLWATLKDTFSMGMSDLVGPIAPMIKDVLGGAIQYITQVTPGAVAAMTEWVNSLYGAGGALDRIGLAYQSVKVGFTGNFLGLAPETLAKLNMDLVGFGATFGAIVGWIRSLDYSSVEGFFNTLTAGIPGIQNLGSTFQRIWNLVMQLTPLFGAFMAELASQAPYLLGAGLNIVTFALQIFVALMPTLLQYMPLIVTAFILWRIQALLNLAVTIALHAVMLSIIIAQNAWRVATAAATAAQWLFNAALNASPMMKVVMLIGLVVGALVWFFTQTELGQQIWSTVMGAIGTALNWLWTNFVQPIFATITNVVGGFFNWVASWAVPFFQTAIGVLGAVVMGLWENFFRPAFEGVTMIVGFAWGILQGIFNALVFILSEIVFPVIMALWEDVVQPAFFLIGEAIKFFWGIAQGIFQLLVSVLQNIVIPIIMALWRETVEPAFNAIGAIIGWVWNTLILPIFSAVVGFIINSLMPPFWTLMGVVQTVWNTIAGAIGGVWEGLQRDVFGPMGKFLSEDVPAMWELAKKLIGVAWDGILAIAKAPITLVVNEVINKGIVGTFNKVADKLPGVGKLNEVKLPDGWRTGGYTGNVRPDEVAGVVHGREYVLREKATAALIRKYGMGGLDYMNQTGRLPDGRIGGGVPAGAQFVGPGTNIFGGQKSYDNVLQKQIAEHRRLNVMGSAAGYALGEAAARWNGLAHVEVGHNLAGMAPAVNVALGEQVAMPGGGQSAGWYSASKIRLGPAYADPATNMTIIVHEIGHALGLPHPHEAGGNNADSIMNYNTTWNHTRPSAADIGALQAIYPGAAKGTNGGGSGGGEPEKPRGGFNPFQFIIDGLGDLIKGAFPKAGMFVDAAVGLVKKTFEDVSNWVLDKIGGFWDWLTGGGDDDKKDNPNGNVQQWATEGLMHTGDFNGMNLTSLIRRIMQESSGDPNAVNMWDSNKSLGGTHGLMQLLNSNFERYRDTTLPKNIYDPLANVVAGIKYTHDRYDGNLRGAWDRKGGYRDGGYVTPLLYDEGGLLEGPAYIDHRKRKPDKVLTDAQWNAMYDRATDDGTGGGDINLHVHGEGQSPQMIGTYAARTIIRKRGRR